jgi:hypothetical protein
MTATDWIIGIALEDETRTVAPVARASSRL